MKQAWPDAGQPRRPGRQHHAQWRLPHADARRGRDRPAGGRPAAWSPRRSRPDGGDRRTGEGRSDQAGDHPGQGAGLGLPDLHHHQPGRIHPAAVQEPEVGQELSDRGRPVGLRHARRPVPHPGQAGQPHWHVPNSAGPGYLAGTIVPPGPRNPLSHAGWASSTAPGIHGTTDIGSHRQRRLSRLRAHVHSRRDRSLRPSRGRHADLRSVARDWPLPHQVGEAQDALRRSLAWLCQPPPRRSAIPPGGKRVEGFERDLTARGAAPLTKRAYGADLARFADWADDRELEPAAVALPGPSSLRRPPQRGRRLGGDGRSQAGGPAQLLRLHAASRRGEPESGGPDRQPEEGVEAAQGAGSGRDRRAAGADPRADALGGARPGDARADLLMRPARRGGGQLGSRLARLRGRAPEDRGQGLQDQDRADGRARPAGAAPLPGARETQLSPAARRSGPCSSPRPAGVCRPPTSGAGWSAGCARRPWPAASRRTRCAIRSRRTCSREGRGCVRFRSCSATPASRQPRSIRGWRRLGCAPSTLAVTREPEKMPARLREGRRWRPT